MLDYQFPKPNEPEKSKDKTDAEIQKKKEQEELELAVIFTILNVFSLHCHYLRSNKYLMQKSHQK